MQHTKMKRLQRALGVPLYAAVGIMECLWHLTAREAPSGNVGKLSNEDIALAIDWTGDSEVLVAALVTSGWIDESEEHRLVVHDWHVHSDDSVDVALARSGNCYASGEAPRGTRLSRQERATLPVHPVVATNSHKKAQVPTGEHKSALPLPVPEPKPEPEPSPLPDVESLEPSMVTTAVMDDLHLSGMQIRIALDEVCNREMGLGMAADDLRTALVEAYGEYETAKPRLSYTVGAAKFFGEWWRNKAGWPWKDGQAPKPAPVLVTTHPTEPDFETAGEHYRRMNGLDPKVNPFDEMRKAVRGAAQKNPNSMDGCDAKRG